MLNKSASTYTFDLVLPNEMDMVEDVHDLNTGKSHYSL